MSQIASQLVRQSCSQPRQSAKGGEGEGEGGGWRQGVGTRRKQGGNITGSEKIRSGKRDYQGGGMRERRVRVRPSVSQCGSRSKQTVNPVIVQ